MHSAGTRLLQALHFLHPMKKPHAQNICAGKLRGCGTVFLEHDIGLNRGGRIFCVGGFKLINLSGPYRSNCLVAYSSVQSGEYTMQVRGPPHRHALSRSAISSAAFLRCSPALPLTMAPSTQ